MTIIFSGVWVMLLILGLKEYVMHNDIMASSLLISSSIMAFVVFSTYKLSVVLKTIAESLKTLANIIENHKKEEK